MVSYLKKLFKLSEFIIKLGDLMKNPIDIKKPKYYFIINKDIVSRHMNTELYKKVHLYNLDYHRNNNAEIDLDSLVQDFNNKEHPKNENIIENEGIKNMFISPEMLKLKCYEYPNNFFILEEDILELFNGYNIKLKTFIGKEGIFIEQSFKYFDGNTKLSIYFVKSMEKVELDNFRLNKIYIYNDENNFLNEFNNHIKGKKAESYFAAKNFLNKGGIFNIIDDGKKIGLYININRKENYLDDENKIDENREYLKKFLE